MYLRLKPLDGLEGPEVRDRLSSLPSDQEASHWDELALDSPVISAATSQLPATQEVRLVAVLDFLVKLNPVWSGCLQILEDE